MSTVVEGEMTTIAYRDGIMASDSLGVRGPTRMNGTIQKIWKLPDGSLVAGAGFMLQFHKSILQAKTYKDIQSPPDKDTMILHVSSNGTLRILQEDIWVELGSPAYYAIGSGDDIAMGALHHGATAAEAVLAAAQSDIYTDDRIVTMTCGGEGRLPEYGHDSIFLASYGSARASLFQRIWTYFMGGIHV